MIQRTSMKDSLITPYHFNIIFNTLITVANVLQMR